MTEIITAIYENGVLRPLQPLRLRESQLVWVSVATEDKESEREASLRALIEEGLIDPPGVDDVPDPVSAEERQYLADLLGRAPGKPLSQIVIEDRGEW